MAVQDFYDGDRAVGLVFDDAVFWTSQERLFFRWGWRLVERKGDKTHSCWEPVDRAVSLACFYLEMFYLQTGKDRRMEFATAFAKRLYGTVDSVLSVASRLHGEVSRSLLKVGFERLVYAYCAATLEPVPPVDLYCGYAMACLRETVFDLHSFSRFIEDAEFRERCREEVCLDDYPRLVQWLCKGADVVIGHAWLDFTPFLGTYVRGRIVPSSSPAQDGRKTLLRNAAWDSAMENARFRFVVNHAVYWDEFESLFYEWAWASLEQLAKTEDRIHVVLTLAYFYQELCYLQVGRCRMDAFLERLVPGVFQNVAEAREIVVRLHRPVASALLVNGFERLVLAYYASTFDSVAAYDGRFMWGESYAKGHATFGWYVDDARFRRSCRGGIQWGRFIKMIVWLGDGAEMIDSADAIRVRYSDSSRNRNGAYALRDDDEFRWFNEDFEKASEKKIEPYSYRDLDENVFRYAVVGKGGNEKYFYRWAWSRIEHLANEFGALRLAASLAYLFLEMVSLHDGVDCTKRFQKVLLGKGVDIGNDGLRVDDRNVRQRVYLTLVECGFESLIHAYHAAMSRPYFDGRCNGMAMITDFASFCRFVEDAGFREKGMRCVCRLGDSLMVLYYNQGGVNVKRLKGLVRAMDLRIPFWETGVVQAERTISERWTRVAEKHLAAWLASDNDRFLEERDDSFRWFSLWASRKLWKLAIEESNLTLVRVTLVYFHLELLQKTEETVGFMRTLVRDGVGDRLELRNAVCRLHDQVASTLLAEGADVLIRAVRSAQVCCCADDFFDEESDPEEREGDLLKRLMKDGSILEKHPDLCRMDAREERELRDWLAHGAPMTFPEIL